jgi:hypothetical protein
MAGTMTVELYRGITRSGIRPVERRNEQGASLMADGYARATGKPGVRTIIAGPGVTNAATGIVRSSVAASGCPPRIRGGRLEDPPHFVLADAVSELNCVPATAMKARSQRVLIKTEIPFETRACRSFLI